MATRTAIGWYIVKGLLAGIGVGVLTCDVFDLVADDPTATNRWMTRIAVCGTTGLLIGSLCGYRSGRRDGVRDASRPSFGYICFLLALAFFHQAINIHFVFSSTGPLAQTYTLTMTAAGACYFFLAMCVFVHRYKTFPRTD